MLVEQEYINVQIALATTPQIGLECTVCDSKMKSPSNCAFCGKVVCRNCIVKNRQFNDDIWHPICQGCENMFLQQLIETQFHTEIEEHTHVVEKAQDELQKLRQQVFELKNMKSVEFAQESDKLKSVQYQVTDAESEHKQLLSKQEYIQQQRDIIREQLKVVQQENEQHNNQIKQKHEQLEQMQLQFQMLNERQYNIQAEIDDLINSENLEGAGYRDTELDNSNYDAIFRGSVTAPQPTFNANNKNNQNNNDKCKVQ